MCILFQQGEYFCHFRPFWWPVGTWRNISVSCWWCQKSEVKKKKHKKKKTYVTKGCDYCDMFSELSWHYPTKVWYQWHPRPLSPSPHIDKIRLVWTLILNKNTCLSSVGTSEWQAPCLRPCLRPAFGPVQELVHSSFACFTGSPLDLSWLLFWLNHPCFGPVATLCTLQSLALQRCTSPEEGDTSM